MPSSKTRSSKLPPAKVNRGKRASAGPAPLAWRGPAAVVTVAVLVAAAAGYLAFRGASDPGGSTAGAKIEHVHGLGVDPADDILYAATHHGLFRVPAQGASTRVAARVQDFMGFTVVGDNHFLASGHPGPGQHGPSALGLIESTDGGNTWTSLSLRGAADFHALKARHGRVYGFDAMTGAFMVSQDKKTWETRSRLPMADFAVSPKDPGTVLATTEGGLARSVDGGRTFAVLSGAPRLLLVSWADDGTLAGVAPDGTLYVSINDGDTWQSRGRVEDPPEALDADSQDDVYVAAGGALLASTDGGRQFTVRYKD